MVDPRYVRAFLLCPLLAVPCACGRPRAAPPEPRSDIAAQLKAADRAFAAAAAARGLDGWMSYMSPAAVRMGRMQNPVRGLEDIRRSDAAIFADSAVRLTWDPTDAGAFDERTGWTVGHSEVRRRAADGTERIERTGRYITIWRRAPDGRWLVVLDTGAGDPPRAP